MKKGRQLNGDSGGYLNLRGPGKADLEKMLRKGMTQQGIADAWFEETGEKVGRTTIAMAIDRYGLKSATQRPRYDDLLPWRVREEHKRHKDADLLRLEGRRRAGEAIRKNDRIWLTNWLNELREADCVVAYAPKTKDGFFWTPRLPEDDDIIRREEVA